MEEPKRYSAYANESSNSNSFLCCFGKSRKYSTKQVETKNELKKSKEALNRNGNIASTNNESNTDSMLTNSSLQFVNYSSLQFIDNIEKDDGKHGKHHECDKCGNNCECDKQHDNHTHCDEITNVVIVEDLRHPIETIVHNQSDSSNGHTDHMNNADNQQLIVAVKSDQTHNTVVQHDYSTNQVADNQHISSSHDAGHQHTTSSYTTSEHHSSSYGTSHHDTSTTNTDTGYSADTGGSNDYGGSSGDTGGTSSYD